jgi:hypothetical protein
MFQSLTIPGGKAAKDYDQNNKGREKNFFLSLLFLT